MDCFTDVLVTFLCVDFCNITAFYGGLESSQIPSQIYCVPKTNKEGLTGLERHETEYFFVNYPFNETR